MFLEISRGWTESTQEFVWYEPWQQQWTDSWLFQPTSEWNVFAPTFVHFYGAQEAEIPTELCSLLVSELTATGRFKNPYSIQSLKRIFKWSAAIPQLEQKDKRMPSNEFSSMLAGWKIAPSASVTLCTLPTPTCSRRTSLPSTKIWGWRMKFHSPVMPAAVFLCSVRRPATLDPIYFPSAAC